MVMMTQADYDAPAERFLADCPDAIIGALTANAVCNVDLSQRNAWLAIIRGLKDVVSQVGESYVFLEFTIPRMGRRVDAVLLNRGCVFVIEYKVGSANFSAISIDQVVGYALDLKNFHEPSHALPIVPILVATSRATTIEPRCVWGADQVAEPMLSNGADLARVIHHAASSVVGSSIDHASWAQGRYKPTPTIVEAAQALYRNHRVEEITRNEAGKDNLSKTATCVAGVIETSKRDQRKSICFVTGVPGSGKTLAGLNIACDRNRLAEDEYAVFLSGNGPLVRVLRAALTRDRKSRTEGTTNLAQAREYRSVEQFIQNIHHFRDANLHSTAAPIEKVVIFDEAQRAWNVQKAMQFMRSKRNYASFEMSEPEFLLSVMDRHADWCTVICLVGHGQEINTGEAGLNEWLNALAKRFSQWDVYLSERLADDPPSYGARLLPCNVRSDERLHLATSIRSFRSELVSSFVSAMIEGEPAQAASFAANLGMFEFNLTRDLAVARDWLRRRRRGTERSGLLAFSNGARLKPAGIYVKAQIDPVDWFLAERLDVRSSDYLEDVATEFDVQGLELDWVAVCIDANIRFTVDGALKPMLFRGTRWQEVNDSERRQYILNAHRVLLTRARQGTIIFIPQGDASDPTRDASWYDALADYFIRCGVKSV